MNSTKNHRHRENNSANVNGADIPIDNLGEAFEKHIRPYIEVIDTLRKHGLQNDIKLPNVVVVGDQSSGKSSIIEAISGVQLPRGIGMVTRCPLELQLKRMTSNVKWKATLSHNGRSVEIDKPEHVNHYIIQAQNEICEGENNISEDLLTLRIESNSKTAPELTLIDLPGIVRLDSVISTKIDKIIKKFVSNPNTVILCMISANLDVNVNEALRIARDHDPENERTIGVITKPDLVANSQKETVLQLLNNEYFPLKKGYRMVKCRCQEELMNGTSLSQSLVNEMQFFKNDKFYKEADTSLLGTINLANKITLELVSIIKKTIPQLKEDIKSQLEMTKREIEKIPIGVPLEDIDKRVYLNTVMQNTLKEMEKLLTKGIYSENNIYLQWRGKFVDFQNKIKAIQAKAFSCDLSKPQLQNSIIDNRGREICGFLNYDLFEKLISKHVERYHPLASQLLLDINKITEDSLVDIIYCFLGHIPDIKREVNILVTRSLESCYAKANENIDLIFDEEKIAFAMDSNFQAQMQAMSQIKNSNNLSLENNSDFLEKILKCYLQIVLNRLCDIIPMTIRQWIHIKLNAELNSSLLRYISEQDSGKKVKENEETRIKRTRLMSKLQRLEIAKQSLTLY